MLTNGGSFHQNLEESLCEYLNVPYLSLFSNGTIALIAALKALGLEGEVITTPFTFVATTHAITWSGMTPVFVDIDPFTLNLDPKKIESAITPKTAAILPVHCYGIPSNVTEIQDIADRHNLKVVYDAAHAFGSDCNCGSLLAHGEHSVLSFHATKLFHTFEGGAVISNTRDKKTRIDRLKNFGFENEITVSEIGTNGKLAEINAAMGLLQLEYIETILKRRSDIAQQYLEDLANVDGIICVARKSTIQSNFSYFPVLVTEDFPITRDQLYERLKQAGIFSRRYFYPLISELPMYKHLPSAASANLPVANKVAQQIICLPIYPELEDSDIKRVVKNIRQLID